MYMRVCSRAPGRPAVSRTKRGTHFFLRYCFFSLCLSHSFCFSFSSLVYRLARRSSSAVHSIPPILFWTQPTRRRWRRWWIVSGTTPCTITYVIRAIYVYVVRIRNNTLSIYPINIYIYISYGCIDFFAEYWSECWWVGGKRKNTDTFIRFVRIYDCVIYRFYYVFAGGTGKSATAAPKAYRPPIWCGKPGTKFFTSTVSRAWYAGNSCPRARNCTCSKTTSSSARTTTYPARTGKVRTAFLFVCIHV